MSTPLIRARGTDISEISGLLYSVLFLNVYKTKLPIYN